MLTTYTITAGNNENDLGVVGESKTVLGAKRIGRAAVRKMLPDGCGSYTIRNYSGAPMLVGERTIRTAFAWAEW